MQLVHPHYGVNVYGNFVNYIQAIEAVGGIPALIHLTADQTVLWTHYTRCQGILLTGGEDVDPAGYGAAPHPRLEATHPLHDAVELQLITWARADQKPLLGICRGMQILNTAYGGTLYQDLPSETTTPIDHRASKSYPNWHHFAHTITIEPDAWLAHHLNTIELQVNTVHHQALKEVAPDLRVVARAPDSIVEAVEGNGAQFVVGVQCHPEMLWDEVDPRWRNLFAGFVAACDADNE